MPAVIDVEELTRLSAALSADLRAAGVDHVLTGSILSLATGVPSSAEDLDLGVVVTSVRVLRSVFDIARHIASIDSPATLLRHDAAGRATQRSRTSAAQTTSRSGIITPPRRSNRRRASRIAARPSP